MGSKKEGFMYKLIYRDGGIEGIINLFDSLRNRRKVDRRKVGKRNMIERLRSKALEVWKEKSRIHGKDLDIWLEAEKMVK